MNTWTSGWWIYYVAPFLGAGLAAMTYMVFFAEEKEETNERERLMHERKGSGDIESKGTSEHSDGASDLARKVVRANEEDL